MNRVLSATAFFKSMWSSLTRSSIYFLLKRKWKLRICSKFVREHIKLILRTLFASIGSSPLSNTLSLSLWCSNLNRLFKVARHGSRLIKMLMLKRKLQECSKSTTKASLLKGQPLMWRIQASPESLSLVSMDMWDLKSVLLSLSMEASKFVDQSEINLIQKSLMRFWKRLERRILIWLNL